MSEKSEDQARWEMLLNASRRKKEGHPAEEKDKTESRTEIERDYDRILFSTPVRRLADKTQVFPLEKNDSVRTRLTHSHEVSNLARSMGTTLAFQHSLAGGVDNACRDIPALLAAIGLVHDLGNPPFGHQGESAIQSWFAEHQSDVLDGCGLNDQQKQDFLRFEGNAQGFRLVTRLQLLNDDFGLDLTYATLAAMMKYPAGSHQIDSNIAAKKKHGYFYAEQNAANAVLTKVGLSVGLRHPLAYVMEACDDIAYVVLDVEDAVKKGLASFSDLMEFLSHRAGADVMIKEVVAQSCAKHKEYRDRTDLSPYELNDVSMQRFRVFAIGALVRATVSAFTENRGVLTKGELASPLLKVSAGKALCSALKDFAFKHAYTHRSVLKIELEGHNVIRRLMDLFWDAIVNRAKESDPRSERCHPFSRFVYGRISENYRRAFEAPVASESALPIRYRECLLLTDMISGMTDSYAIELHDELNSIIGGYSLLRKAIYK
jgi:dGTPase